MTQEEIDRMEKKALEQFTTGKSLFGKDGAFVDISVMLTPISVMLTPLAILVNKIRTLTILQFFSKAFTF